MRRTMVMTLLGGLFLALTTGAALATTDAGPRDGRAEASRQLTVKQIRFEPFSGRESGQIVIAPSAKALSEAIDEKVRYVGKGTYLAAFYGTRQSAGYSIAVSSASKTGDRVLVKLALGKPDPDMQWQQAFSYPYTVASIKNLNPEAKNFYFFTESGRRLDWPVKRVSG